jgi:hypothetical protein
MDTAQVTSLLPRGDSNFKAQYFKSNMFDGFRMQACQFSSVNVLYPDVIIKVSLPHIEVSYLNVFQNFVIVKVLSLILIYYI